MKKDLTVGREWKLILLFTLPIMAGSVLQQLYNTVDGIVVGNFIGADAFAGVGTCGALGFLFLAVAMGLGVGISVTISQYYGARRFGDMNAAIDTSLILMGLTGIVFSVVGYAFSPFLLRTLLGVPEKILPYAVLYFRIYSIGLVFQFIYNGASFILRGLGDSRASLYFLLVSTVLNGVLALLFVITLHWGVAGTGIATVIAQAVCAGLALLYLKKRFKFDNTGRHFDKTAFRHVLRYGIPSAIQQTILSVGSGAMNRLVNSFGEVSIAAYAAALRINMVAFTPAFSFQAGLAGFTGQNIGAGRLDRVKRGLRSTLIMGLGLAAVLCVLLFIFAPSLIKLFALDGEALTRGIEQIHFYAALFLSFILYAIMGGVLQGAGDVVILSVSTLLSLIVRVSTGYAGVHFGILGHEAAWVTDPIGWNTALIILVIRYLTGKWKTKAVIGQAPGDEPEPLCPAPAGE